METTSLLLALSAVIISALLLIATVKDDARARIRVGLKGNMPWLALLLFTMAIDMIINLLVPNPIYLWKMSAKYEILAGLSSSLQDIIPALFGNTFFATLYFIGFAVCIITLPLYLLAMGEDVLFKRYCLALSFASIILVLFKITVLSVRPSLDPNSGSLGPLFPDPFWGPISLDFSPKGNSFPSGHAITLMAAAIAIWPLKHLRIAVLVLLSLIVVAVLYLEVHWPVDVIAGIALGLVCGLTAIMVVERLGRKEIRQT